MEWLSSWTLWLIGGFALLILEAIIPGVFLMWWGLAAVVVAGVVGLLPWLGLGWQVSIFAVLATLLSLFWWRYQHQKDQQDDQISALNQRDHAMIGAMGVIVELQQNGIARGKFGDTTWRVEGSPLSVGQTVKVVSVEGITLKVITL